MINLTIADAAFKLSQVAFDDFTTYSNSVDGSVVSVPTEANAADCALNSASDSVAKYSSTLGSPTE
jgi:hypothetical protein